MPPYKALGFLVWHGARIYLKQRYGDGGPKRVGIGLAVAGAGAIGVAVFVQRRAGGDDE